MMKDMTISTERVLELIAAYGAEPGAWPEDERAAATKLVTAAPDLFAAALEDARVLDLMLQDEQVPEPGPRVSDAILAAAPAPKAAARGVLGGLSALIFPQGVRWPAGAALASLMMGLVGGYAYASTGAGYDQADLAYYAAFGVESGEDWLGTE
ncbi:MAG: hypothetical protein AAGA89_02440 [Pseudomonadota bacterium]